MTISVTSGQLRVSLTETETIKYNIDYVFFDKSSRKSAEALATLLELAAVKCGFKTDAKRFQIELYPVFSGGCEIYFIPDQPKSGLTDKPKISRWSVFEFDSTDGMLLALETIYRNKHSRYCTSALYKSGSSYRLTVKGLSEQLHRTIRLDLADRVLTDNGILASTQEHWTAVCPKNAIAIIGAALCHNSSVD